MSLLDRVLDTLGGRDDGDGGDAVRAEADAADADADDAGAAPDRDPVEGGTVAVDASAAVDPVDAGRDPAPDGTVDGDDVEADVRDANEGTASDDAADPFEPAVPVDADADDANDTDANDTDANDADADAGRAVDDYVEVGIDVDDYVDLGSARVDGTESYVDAERLVPDVGVDVGGVEGGADAGTRTDAAADVGIVDGTRDAADVGTVDGTRDAAGSGAETAGDAVDPDPPSIDLSAVEAFDATEGFDWVDQLPEGPGAEFGDGTDDGTADDPADSFAAVTGFDPGPADDGPGEEGTDDGWTLGGSLDGNVTRVTASTDVAAEIGEGGDPPPDIDDVDGSFGDGGGLDPDNITRATGTSADEAVERLRVFSSRADRRPAGADGTGVDEGDRTGGIP
jgi:hypothetical protein